MSTRETYLGDGLYVSFDGYQFTLRAPREGGNHFICLEPSVLAEFEQFIADVRTGQQVAEGGAL